MFLQCLGLCASHRYWGRVGTGIGKDWVLRTSTESMYLRQRGRTRSGHSGSFLGDSLPSLLLGLLKALPRGPALPPCLHLLLLFSLSSITPQERGERPDLLRIRKGSKILSIPTLVPNIKLISRMSSRSSLAHRRCCRRLHWCDSGHRLSIISLKVFLADFPWRPILRPCSLSLLLLSGRLNQNNSAGKDSKVPAGRGGQNLPTSCPASHSNPRTLNSGHLQGKPWK